jgi:hypothetical protein
LRRREFAKCGVFAISLGHSLSIHLILASGPAYSGNRQKNEQLVNRRKTGVFAHLVSFRTPRKPFPGREFFAVLTPITLNT